MAKRKTRRAGVKKPLTEEPLSGTPIEVDNILAKTVTDVERKTTKKGFLVGDDDLIHVLPVPSLLMRYLMQNEGFPLSRFYQIVGEEASYKSTFAIEILRCHRMCNGIGLLLEAETKPTPDLRNSVLNWDTRACKVENCRTMDEWMTKLTFYIGSPSTSMHSRNSA
jgi:hypothetical protein